MRVSQSGVRHPPSLSTTGLLMAGLFTSLATSQTIWIQASQATLNSTDDFLIPLSFGSGDGRQTVLMNPSLSHKDTFVFGPQTCMPEGEDAPRPGCVLYRGGVFDPEVSETFSEEANKIFKYENKNYKIFAHGVVGSDTIMFENNGNAVDEVEGYEFATIEATNMTAGNIGLGKGSMILDRLVKDGKIGSRSFGLHVGVDIWNHPWPILNPSFDESGSPPLTEEDYSSGSSKRSRKRQEPTEVFMGEGLLKRESHKFPGSLTLGGYDKSKLAKDSTPLKGPISKEGSLDLLVTKMVFQNRLPESPYQLLKKPWKAVIDPDTPYLHLPELAGWWTLATTIGAPFGEPREDFFYANGFADDSEEDLGNITMTLQIPGNTKEEIEILIPPTVLYQPIGYLRNFEPVGNNDFNWSLPIRTFRDDDETKTIVLGRAFLKAAYLFVNHDTNNFQVSQVSFRNATTQIVPIAANQDPSLNDIPLAGDGFGSGSGPNNNPSGTGASEPSPPGMSTGVLAGAIGGGVVLLALAAGIFFVIKRRRNAQAHKKLHKGPTGLTPPALPPSAPSHVNGGRLEMDGSSHAVQLQNLSPTGARPDTAVSKNSMQTVHLVNTNAAGVGSGPSPVGYINELPNDEKYGHGGGVGGVYAPPPPAYNTNAAVSPQEHKPQQQPNGSYHEMPMPEQYNGTQPSPAISPYIAAGQYPPSPGIAPAGTNPYAQQQLPPPPPHPQGPYQQQHQQQQYSELHGWDAGPVPGKYEMM